MKSRCKIKIKRLLVLNVKIGHATSRSKIKKRSSELYLFYFLLYPVNKSNFSALILAPRAPMPV